MGVLKHYKAIRCIEKRIADLQEEKLMEEKIMDNPELPSCEYYASINIKNFNQEIDELRETLQELIKQ